MRKLTAALIAAGALGATAPAAVASDPIVAPGPCEQVSQMFETANIEMYPTPEPTGTVVRAVCKRTG